MDGWVDEAAAGGVHNKKKKKNIVEIKNLNPILRGGSSTASSCPLESHIGVSLRIAKQKGSQRCMHGI